MIPGSVTLKPPRLCVHFWGEVAGVPTLASGVHAGLAVAGELAIP